MTHPSVTVIFGFHHIRWGEQLVIEVSGSELHVHTGCGGPDGRQLASPGETVSTALTPPVPNPVLSLTWENNPSAPQRVRKRPSQARGPAAPEAITHNGDEVRVCGIRQLERDGRRRVERRGDGDERRVLEREQGERVRRRPRARHVDHEVLALRRRVRREAERVRGRRAGRERRGGEEERNLKSAPACKGRACGGHRASGSPTRGGRKGRSRSGRVGGSRGVV